MTLRLVTDATAEPVTIAEIKEWSVISTVSTVDESLISAAIKTARLECENKIKRPLMPQTWKLVFEDFPSKIVLPRPPISTNSSDVTITFLDETSGDSTTMAKTSVSTCRYIVDVDAEPAEIFLKASADWPNVYDQQNAISVQFICGFPLKTTGTTGAGGSSQVPNAPENAKTWIKMRVGSLFENREGHVVANINQGVQETPRSFFDGLLDDLIMIEVSP